MSWDEFSSAILSSVRPEVDSPYEWRDLIWMAARVEASAYDTVLSLIPFGMPPTGILANGAFS